MSNYLVIPHLEISNANAQPAWWLVGPPPITAYLGFAHALALKLDCGTHQGIAVIHHDIQMLGEEFYDDGVRTLAPHQYRAASFIDQDDYTDKNKRVLSGQPSARCHLKVSVVIRLADDAPVRLSRVPHELRGGRVAGGSILSHGEPYFRESYEASSAQLLAGIGSGFSIVSRQDLMVLADGDRDMLDVVLRVTRSIKDKVAGKCTVPAQSAPVPDESHAWLMPTAIGYAEITSREHRKNVRGGNLHAYAEPLVSLVQYQSCRDAGLHFWRYSHPAPTLFVATTD